LPDREDSTTQKTRQSSLLPETFTEVRNIYTLAEQANGLLKYRKVSENQHPEIYIQSYKKGRINGVTVWPNSITIYQQNYDVTFYMHKGETFKGGWSIDGVLINGWPDNDVIENLLEVWNWPELTMKYRLSHGFLEKNPMYRRPLPGKKEAKKVHASQIEI
jgi:hypothetical protein